MQGRKGFSNEQTLVQNEPRSRMSSLFVRAAIYGLAVFSVSGPLMAQVPNTLKHSGMTRRTDHAVVTAAACHVQHPCGRSRQVPFWSCDLQTFGDLLN